MTQLSASNALVVLVIHITEHHIIAVLSLSDSQNWTEEAFL